MGFEENDESHHFRAKDKAITGEEMITESSFRG
jgi:hypothetical protein